MLESADSQGILLAAPRQGNYPKRLLRLAQPLRCQQRLPRLAEITLKLAAFCLIFLWTISPTVAQPQRARVKFQLLTPNTIRIALKARQPLKDWSFINSYAGALGLGQRVQDFRADGAVVTKISSGVFQADHPIDSVTYDIRLDIEGVRNPAYVSWLTEKGGVLMLADLLPLEVLRDAPIDAHFELPASWQLPSFLRANEASDCVIDDPTNTVIPISPSMRSRSKTVNGLRLDVAVCGDWPFSHAKATEAAALVLKEYLKLTRFPLPGGRIVIAPLPKHGPDTWQAQTRGTTLLLLLDPAAGFENWIGQLKVIFTHELLHLWVPNALNLKGDYDWFFEGFTLYQALVTAVHLKVISFDEYLNTLARVYDSYRLKPDRLSLIEASEQRWTGATSAVYDKGMLVALLYDLLLRSESGGKSKLSDRYADLFRTYASKTVDANEAIMSLLGFSTATADVLKSYVQEHRPIELNETLKRYGFVLQTSSKLTELKIANNPTTDQLRLLRSLGYRR